LYSLWGDPWGGWAFGSRYLIPSYAILAIFSGFYLDKVFKNAQNYPHRVWGLPSHPVCVQFLKFITITIIIYSVSVNTLGALTSIANPPKIQVLELEKLSGKVEKYTYQRNIDLLFAGKSTSYVYKTLAKDLVSAWGYYFLIDISILIVTLSFIYKLTKINTR
jgi:hypothetical protein